MGRFEDLKAKYQSVLDLIPNVGIKLQNVHVENDKLFVRGAAPNENIKNKVWNQIKVVDPSYGDLTCDITIDPSLPVPAATAAATSGPSDQAEPAGNTYTVQPGDTLSKLSKQFYGNANLYMKIFQANRDQLLDPNVIKVGQVLKIPEG